MEGFWHESLGERHRGSKGETILQFIIKPTVIDSQYVIIVIPKKTVRAHLKCVLIPGCRTPPITNNNALCVLGLRRPWPTRWAFLYLVIRKGSHPMCFILTYKVYFGWVEFRHKKTGHYVSVVPDAWSHTGCKLHSWWKVYVRLLHLTPTWNPQTTFSLWKLLHYIVCSVIRTQRYLASLEVKRGVNAKMSISDEQRWKWVLTFHRAIVCFTKRILNHPCLCRTELFEDAPYSTC